MDTTNPAKSVTDRIIDLFFVIDARSWESLRGMLSADVEYERPGYPPFVGRDRVLGFYQHERMIDSGVHELTRIIAQGNTCACCGRFLGVKKDGTTVDVRFADVYEFDGELIKKRTSYFFTPTV